MKQTMYKAKRTKKFKSRFEEVFAKNMERHGIEYEYEKVKLKYLKEHEYRLDFSLSSGKILIETKGYFTAADRQKMLDVKKAHPDLDIRFVFMADQKIHKLSKTRYSDWCNKNNFKFAISKEGNIPEEWLEEIQKEDAPKKNTKKQTKV